MMLFKTVFLFAIAFIFSTTTHAAVNSWTSIGPAGGQINQVTFDPSAPTTVYAAANGGVYKTTNNGQVWSLLLAEYAYRVILTSDGGRIFAALSDGLHVSNDGGNSWTAINLSGLTFTVNDLAISGQSMLALKSDDSLFYSSDLGESFTNITGFNQALSIKSVMIDPVDTSRLYLATNNGIYFSDNNGASWSAAVLPDGFSDVAKITADPNNATVFYATTSAGIIKSVDSGMSWVAVLTDSGFSASSYFLGPIVVDPKDSNIIYASKILSGMYRSSDAGAHWTKVNNITATSIAVHPSIANKVLLSNLNNLFVSTNSGDTWSTLSVGLNGTSPKLITVQPGTGDVFVGDIYGRGLTRGNGTAPLTPVAGGLNATPVRALAFDPVDSDTLYAGGLGNLGGIYKSNNGGNTWSAANAGLFNRAVTSLAISPLDANFLLLGNADDDITGASNLSESSNAALSWQQLPVSSFNNSHIKSIAINPTNDNIIYVATDKAGIQKSINKGRTWRGINTDVVDNNIKTIVINPNNNSEVWAFSSARIYRSTDAGTNWSQPNFVTVDQESAISGDNVVFHPSNSSVFFTGNYLTKDSGSSWCELSTGLLPGITAEKVAIDNSDPNKLYITTAFNGAFSIELMRQNPVANAGSDFTYNDNSSLNIPLRGNGSTDEGGCIQHYSWAQISGPSLAAMPGNLASTSFEPSANGLYEFELTVRDNDGDTSTDRVVIDVQTSLLSSDNNNNSGNNGDENGGGGGGSTSYLLALLILMAVMRRYSFRCQSSFIKHVNITR